ncbi:MAG: FAD-binding oxidoreductase [Acidimicrobiales bacterium]|nr:FAD-binding oxidoreductase [Acidimicrobiales bacterium]
MSENRMQDHTPDPVPEPGPGAPTPPIPITGGAEHASARFGTTRVEVPGEVIERLRGACASVTADRSVVAESSRDWWPLAMTWAVEGQVPALASVVARPASKFEVPDILRICNEAKVPVTAAAGRSGVCGSAVPLYGGVILDLCDLNGIVHLDATSLILDVAPGTFGDHLEYALRNEHNVTLGHWPQSMALSTVGGWLACRSAGQLSTRYGKIEDMVIGLDVALADGTAITTGGNARQAVGPDLNQLFVGSEGTLGIITGARLRVHPAPVHEERAAFGFATFEDGLDACRRILRRGATPAVLRLYDTVESQRNFGLEDVNVLLVLDEGDPGLVVAAMRCVYEECSTGSSLDSGLVERWLGHRNDVSALEKLIAGGLVVDTMEITGPWSKLPEIYRGTIAALRGVDGTLAASAHLSHSYPDGACLYFTFAGKVAPDAKDAYYRAVWDAGTRVVLSHGGALSHHHGVGINRARFIRELPGNSVPVLAAIKQALDPNGILNPGKLGLPSPFGTHPFAETVWP